MGQRVEHRALVLAVLPEFGPVVGHRLVVVHQPALRLDVERSRGHCFYVGKHRKQGVSIHLLSGGLVGHATPLVDHQFAVQVCCHLDTDLPTFSNGDIYGILYDALRTHRHGGASLWLLVN